MKSISVTCLRSCGQNGGGGCGS